MNGYSLSKKYARAFCAIFGQTLNQAKLENIQGCVQFLTKHKHALYYLQLVASTRESKKIALSELIHLCHLTTEFDLLVDLLLKHKRIYLITDILVDIVQITQEKLGIADFVVTTPTELDEQSKEKVKSFLSGQTRKEIILHPKIDTRLIAGIKMVSNELGWEYSIAKQLRTLRKSAVGVY